MHGMKENGWEGPFRNNDAYDNLLEDLFRTGFQFVFTERQDSGLSGILQFLLDDLSARFVVRLGVSHTCACLAIAYSIK